LPQRLDTWQVNMLVTGQALAAEIPAPSPQCRAWVYVTAYSVDPTNSARHGRPSKFLNADHSDVHFRLRVFEVAETDMPTVRADPLNSDYYEKDIICQDDIASIHELESLLCAHVVDFAMLINAVNVDYLF